MLFLTVCPVQQPPTAAALCVHGIYRSVAEARQAVGDLARDQEDVPTYVIDDTQRWLPVLEPLEGSRVSGELEEIACTENEDPSSGRTGSVCNVRRSNRPDPPPNAAAPSSSSTPSHPGVPASALADPMTKKKEAQRQHHQLDDLLRGEVPPECPLDAPGYAALRGRLATLRAFERKLVRLCDESRELCERSVEVVRQLDAKHPEYVGQYVDNYKRALREVGMRPEDVGLLRFFSVDDQSAAAVDR